MQGICAVYLGGLRHGFGESTETQPGIGGVVRDATGARNTGRRGKEGRDKRRRKSASHRKRNGRKGYERLDGRGSADGADVRGRAGAVITAVAAFTYSIGFAVVYLAVLMRGEEGFEVLVAFTDGAAVFDLTFAFPATPALA